MNLQATVRSLVLLGLIKICAFEQEGASRTRRRLTKRQTAEDLGPIPYTARANEPIPYQQGPGPNQNDATGGNGDSSDLGLYPAYQDSDPGRRTGGGHGAGGPSASGRQYYRYQPPVSTSRGGVPTDTHVSDVTRYSYTRPITGSDRTQGRTYEYPFGGGVGGGGGGVGEGVGDSRPDPAVAGQFYSASLGVSTQNEQSGASDADDDEPVVTVYPSEQPVNPTYSSRQQYEELLRQRNAERQRLLQERQRQQQQQQQQQQQGGSVAQGQRRPIYTGSEQLGGRIPGQSSYRPYQQRPQSGGNPFTSGRRPPAYAPGGPFQPTYAGQQQQPYYNFGYTDPGYDTSGYSSECPNTGIRIQINGIPCEAAIDRYGSYLCYRHEYTSQECCQKCLTLKNPARIGCEYGDHSGRCSQLQSYDCYDLRNRQSCCATCERLQRPGARAGCEYGDMTPNCDRVRQNPGLCYIPENRYLCCDTCNNIRADQNTECPWGDQNSELCQPFDQNGNIRINCYAPPIRRICCQSCQRLQEWIPIDVPGCEYGDKPVTFNTGTHRNLNCTSFMRYFGYEQCTINQAVSTNCCFTCHRYTQG